MCFLGQCANGVHFFVVDSDILLVNLYKNVLKTKESDK